MAVTTNMKGTTFPTFRIHKNGPTIHQGAYTPTANAANGDLHIEHGTSGKMFIYNNGWKEVGSTSENTVTTGSSTLQNVYDTSSQHVMYILNGTTTDATEKEIYLNEQLQTQININNDTAGLFEARFIARDHNNAETAAYTIKGVIVNDGGNITLINDATEEIIAETNTSWTANVAADTTNSALSILCTGTVGDSVKWTVFVDLLSVRTSATGGNVPTYTLVRSVDNVNEGSTFTVTLATTNVAQGTYVPYTISNIASADISNAPLTGNFIVGVSDSITYTVSSDQITEGEEAFFMELDNNESNVYVTFNDTSFSSNPTYTLSSSHSTINEGQQLSITLLTTNVTDGTPVPFTITGVDSADLNGQNLTGNLTIQNGSATIAYNIAEDLSTSEGSETLVFSLDGGQDSISIDINDSSYRVLDNNTIMLLKADTTGNYGSSVGRVVDETSTINWSSQNLILDAFTPYGDSTPSYYFPGSGGEMVTLPIYDGESSISANYSIEFAFKLKTLPQGDQALVSSYIEGQGGSWRIAVNNGNLKVTSGNNFANVIGITSLDINTWYHVAVIKDGASSIKVYLNGNVEASSGSFAWQNFNEDIFIGGSDGGQQNLHGWITDLRVVQGVATRTGTYTPNTAPLSTVGNTVVQILNSPQVYSGPIKKNGFSAIPQFENNNSSNVELHYHSPYKKLRILDIASNKGSYNTIHGSNQPYAISNTNSNVAFGTNAYTIEGWFMMRGGYDFGNVATFFDSRGGATGGIMLQATAGGDMILHDGASNVTLSTTFPTNKWTHVAISRLNDTTSVYLDGYFIGKRTDSGGSAININQNVMRIGMNRFGSNVFDGLWTDVRITNGSSLYSGISEASRNFVLPTNWMSSATGTVTLLQATGASELNLSGIGGIIGTHNNGFATASNGLTHFAEDTFRIHNGYFRSDIPFENFSGLVEWTIEGWFYTNGLRANGGSEVIYGGSNSAWGKLEITNPSNNLSGRTIKFTDYTGTVHTSTQLQGTGMWTDDTWTYFAVSYDGSDTKVFIDGRYVLKVTHSGNAPHYTSNAQLTLGGSTTSDGINGYMHDVQVSALARYLANDASTSLGGIEISVPAGANSAPSPTYSLTSDVSNVNEGGTVTFTLTTTNLADATTIPYTITGIDANDLSSGSLTGNFTLVGNTATASFTLAGDTSTEGAETMTLTLDNGSTALDVTVNDTSITDFASYTWGDVVVYDSQGNTLDVANPLPFPPSQHTATEWEDPTIYGQWYEGETITWEVTTDAPDGTQVYWYVGKTYRDYDIDDDPVYDLPFSGPGSDRYGTITVSGGKLSGTYTLNIADGENEAGEFSFIVVQPTSSSLYTERLTQSQWLYMNDWGFAVTITGSVLVSTMEADTSFTGAFSQWYGGYDYSNGALNASTFLNEGNNLWEDLKDAVNSSVSSWNGYNSNMAPGAAYDTIHLRVTITENAQGYPVFKFETKNATQPVSWGYQHDTWDDGTLTEIGFADVFTDPSTGNPRHLTPQRQSLNYSITD